MDDSKFVILGANGQIGTALRAQYPNARALSSAELDISDKAAVEAFDWSNVTHILNAAAYTNVDGAETPEGRVAAWKVNASAVENLIHPAWRNDIIIVHISTDYVFDGTVENHSEDEPFSPLSIYGASKAAGDIVISGIDNHYILRTTWVVGDGKNFVRTMLGLGEKAISPTVVADQVGRLSFASEIVRAINHLLATQAPFGTYNVTNDGEPASWAAITREIFKVGGYNGLTVTDTTTAEYFAGKEGIAPRPLNSVMNLNKLHATGFTSRDWHDDLKEYVIHERRSE